MLFTRVCLLLFTAILAVRAAPGAVENAVAALERGNLADAERMLRAHVQSHPSDAEALGVLGVVLDRESKLDAAGQAYRRALVLEPRSAALLNNYGNHLLAAGQSNAARPVFLKVLALDPHQQNATVQLARIALEHKAPAEALRYLERLPASALDPPDRAALRMQALYGVGRTREADAILASLPSAPEWNFHTGVALASAGQYAKAEEYFSRAVETEPDNFDALYNLGLAASRAGHRERARDVLQQALTRQPANVDVMLDLAAIEVALHESDTAVRILAKADSAAPQRADVQRALAEVTGSIGFYGDAVEAWDRYLRLKPQDQIARRERAFAQTALAENVPAAIAELRKYVDAHRTDATGYFELGTAEAPAHPQAARTHLDRALALQPALTGAYVARGILLYRQGQIAAAQHDFESAAKLDPTNPAILDRLGQTYLALERPSDALPLLKKASELAPRESRILMHLSQALSRTGDHQQAAAVMARFRELGPDRSALPHPAGLVDFLNLSPRQQRDRYRAGVLRTLKAHPDNAEAQLAYMKLLLEDGSMDQAADVSLRISALHPSAALIADTASALLRARQYEAAERCLSSAPPGSLSPASLIDLALALAHTGNPEAALRKVDELPVSARATADYAFARTAILDMSGRGSEAVAAAERALELPAGRADLCRAAAAVLVRNGRTPDAVALLDRAARSHPDDPKTLLAQAAVTRLAGRKQDADRLFAVIERRWPDWPAVYQARALTSSAALIDVALR